MRVPENCAFYLVKMRWFTAVRGFIQCLREAGTGFTFVPCFHHGLRHTLPVRKALGVPTAINYLAPLTNPASPRAALVGCSNTALAQVAASVLAERGASALVVCGEDGLDEIAVAAPANVWIAAAGADVRQKTLDVTDFGLARSTPDALRGGDAVCNASVVHRVLAGEPGGGRDGREGARTRVSLPGRAAM